MPRPLFRVIAPCTLFAAATSLTGAAEPRPAPQLVAELCVACHNQNLVGNPAPNLVDGLWTHGGNDESVLRSIRQGFPNSGMQAFEGILTETEMQGVLRHIRQLAGEYAAGRIKHPKPPDSVIVASERYNFRVETFIPDLDTPWGLAFLPNNEIALTEREGRLRFVRNGKLDAAPIRDTPNVFFKQDGGMLDVIAHPDYAKNGWLYLAFSEAGATPDVSMTRVVRGRVRDGRWVDQQDIFRAPPERYYPGWIHYGCRFLFDRDGYLYFTIGDRGKPEDSQDFASPSGKIHRVFDDGRIPPDNPFVKRPGAWPSIWSMGNRHVQGLQFHPVTGKMWATEHGPSGGDELNRIEGGRNYGWPVIGRLEASP